ncbi:heavy-metal-associated domain-containing protein [Microbacterium halophytorum]|uniref:heavy-metal-associated domain-containing protein n=1 Tax=Microbacterium halophytorum TaxID=2067568 RepID=UPI001E400982|nr:heavy-metal-associated domain-containing protein [Microbacterium halophytorum]
MAPDDPAREYDKREYGMAIERIDLGLKDVSASGDGCCGGGGSCGCGSADAGSGHGHGANPAATTVTAVRVDGMTCGHCVSSVTEEVGKIAGVSSVSVDLVADGFSTVTVRSTGPVSADDLATAIDEAGYALVS